MGDDLAWGDDLFRDTAYRPIRSRTCTTQLRVVINKTLSPYQPASRTILYDSLVLTDANVRICAIRQCEWGLIREATRRRMVSSRFASDYIGGQSGISARPILLEALRYFVAKFCRASYDILLGNASFHRYFAWILLGIASFCRYFAWCNGFDSSIRVVRVRVVDL